MNAILNSRLFQTFKQKKANPEARFSFYSLVVSGCYDTYAT